MNASTTNSPRVGSHRTPTVLFVCHANRFRSPLAEWVLRLEAARAGIGVRSFSRGVAAKRGDGLIATVATFLKPMSPESQLHQSEPLKDNDVAAADCIVAMDRACRDSVFKISRRRCDVYLCGEVIGQGSIRDPMQGDPKTMQDVGAELEAHQKCIELVTVCAKAWLPFALNVA